MVNPKFQLLGCMKIQTCNAWGEDVRLFISVRLDLYQAIINLLVALFALILEPICAPICTYTLQGTNPYPTKREKEHHRLKSAGWYGIL